MKKKNKSIYSNIYLNDNQTQTHSNMQILNSNSKNKNNKLNISDSISNHFQKNFKKIIINKLAKNGPRISTILK